MYPSTTDTLVLLEQDGPRRLAATLARFRPACSWQLGASGSPLHWRAALEGARVCPYPPPSREYPMGVLDHPGILHRNSCTKSRAIASSLVARLKRRDRSCIGDDLGPESLGDGVSRATSARALARPPNRSPIKPPVHPSSVARHDFQRPEVVWSQAPNLAGYVRGYGQKWPESCTERVLVARFVQ
jgi:hypothetical protein